MSRDFLPGFNVAGNLGFARGVMLLEDCEGAFTWLVTGTGGDDVHAFAAVAAFMGGFGMHLKTRVTGAAVADSLTVTKRMGYPESGLLVLRTRVAFVAAATFDYLQVGWDIGDGVNTWAGAIYIDPQAGTVHYQSAAGPLVELTGLAVTPLDGQFLVLEIVLDLRAMRYVRCTWAGLVADMTGLGLVAAGAGPGRYFYPGITIQTDGAAPAELYVDQVYVGEFLSA